MTESDVEDAALAWFGELGYGIRHGPDIGPEEPAPERSAWGQDVVVDPSTVAWQRIVRNPAPSLPMAGRVRRVPICPGHRPR